MQTTQRHTAHPVRFCLIVALSAILGVVGYTAAVTSPVWAAPQPAISVETTRQAQYVLISHGYQLGRADGVLGPRTKAAVRKWQRANGLVVDGVPGPVTLSSLLASVAPSASAPAVRLNPPLAPVLGDSGRSGGNVEQIIRDVWGGEPQWVIDKAVRTAWRESNHVPTVRNYCCFGLFQIYYSQHRAWLGDYGVNQASDLFDPYTNATVALALYHSSGWGPWAGGA